MVEEIGGYWNAKRIQGALNLAVMLTSEADQVHIVEDCDAAIEALKEQGLTDESVKLAAGALIQAGTLNMYGESHSVDDAHQILALWREQAEAA